MSGNLLERVSVIVPCRNEREHLEACLQSIISQQEMQGRLEILVVDGRSEDNSAQIVRAIAERHPTIRLLDNPAKSTPIARNIGIREASGKYICIVDARNTLSPRYLIDGITRLQTSSALVCVGGRLLSKGTNEQGNLIASAMSSPFGVGGKNFRALTSEQFVDTVAVPIYRRQSLMDVGLFDETLARNQDDDLNYRLRIRGGKILYFPQIQAEYVVRDSLKKLFEQYQQYGYWKVVVNKKHKAPTSFRQLVPPFALILFFSLIFLSAASDLAVTALLTLMSTYAALSVVFTLRAGLKIKMLPRLSIVFSILHVSYGLGYLRGIWEFLILRRSAPDNYFAKLTR